MLKKIRPFSAFLAISLFLYSFNIFGIYNLSAFYIAKVISAFSYSSIGAVSVPTLSWQSGKLFGANKGDGYLQNGSDIELDDTNNIVYVADSTNNAIYKFNFLTGAVIGAIGKTSVASGTCILGAQTNWCTGGKFAAGTGDGEFFTLRRIKIDLGNNYLYALEGNRVQKFNLSTGAFIGSIGLSTASGTCIAGSQTTWCTGGVFSTGMQDGNFDTAYDLDIDPATNTLLVISTTRVQKFHLANGDFVGAIGYSSGSGTCVAGKQAGWCVGAGFSSVKSDGAFKTGHGITIAAAKDRFYTTDISSYSVQQFVLSTGAHVGSIGYSAIAGGTCAAGGQSGWCAGVVFSFSLSQEKGFYQPRGIANDGTSLYVSDTVQTSVKKFNLNTGAFEGLIGRLGGSQGTCVAGVQSGWCINGTTNSFSTVEEDGSFPNSPGLAVSTTLNTMLVIDAAKVQKFNLSTGAFQGAWGGALTASSTWATNAGATKKTETGGVTGGMYGAEGIAADLTNNILYVVDTSRVQKFNLSTGAYIGVLTGESAFTNVHQVEVDAINNRLYVTSWTKVEKFNLTTGAFIGAIGNHGTGAGTCVAGAQSGWCTGGGSGFVTGTTDGSFNDAKGIAIDTSEDALYVADATYRIQKFTLSTGAFVGSIGKSAAQGTCAGGAQSGWCTGGSFSTGSSSTDETFFGISSIRVDSTNHRLIASDTSYGRIQKFNSTTGAFIGAIGLSSASGTCVAGKQNGWCTGGSFSSGYTSDGQFNSQTIAIDVGNNLLYVANGVYGSVQKFNLATGAHLGTFGLSTAAGTCIAGAQTNWCTGGSTQMSFTSSDGVYVSIQHIQVANNRLYIADYGTISRVIQP